MRRMFPERAWVLFYDIGDGLSFGSADVQKRFFEWLEVFDSVEGTNYRATGLPRSFTQLAPLLRRFFLAAADDKKVAKGVTLVVDFPEKNHPRRRSSEAVAESGLDAERSGEGAGLGRRERPA